MGALVLMRLFLKHQLVIRCYANIVKAIRFVENAAVCWAPDFVQCSPETWFSWWLPMGQGRTKIIPQPMEW